MHHTPGDYSLTNLGKWITVDRSTAFLNAPYAPSVKPEILQNGDALAQSLGATLASVCLPTICVKETGRTKLPRNSGDFGLSPLWSNCMSGDSLEFDNVMAPPNVSFETTQYNASGDFHSIPAEPHVDGHIGVGLTLSNRLVALCMGVASTDGPIITQLQDVSQSWDTQNDCPTRPYKNGLRSGIDWKRTLAKVWLQTVPQVLAATGIYEQEKPVWVQSAINNQWLRDTSNERMQRPLPETREQFIARINERLRQFEHTYDATAIALGGVRDDLTSNFKLPKP